MSSHLGYCNGAHGLGPQPPHFAIPHDANGHLETPRISLISAKLDELLRHTNFDHCSPIIQGLFEASPRDWDAFVYVRLDAKGSLFRTHYTSIYYHPPPDIFDLVAQIRKDKSWTAKRQEVITQVGHARRPSGSSWPEFGGSGLSPSHTTHLAAPTGSVQSAALDSQSLLSPGGRCGRRSSGCQTSNRNSSGAAGSPTPTEGYITAVNGGRTAPKDQRFYCPSKNCSKSYPRQGYIRQGHYERHMQTCHAEWVSHDPATSLREIPIPTGEHPDGGNMDEHVSVRMSAEATWLVASHPPLAPSTPYTPLHVLEPGHERPATPSPENILPEIVHFGAQAELSHHMQESFTPALPARFDGISQPNWGNFDVQQPFLLPSSQTPPTSNQSLYSTDSYMEG